MPGIFKKLSANDIKITPFEAHKFYRINNNLASIGASTASLAWSNQNKSTFSSGSKQYYQIDKLYYRNYIQERANRLELDDATYTTQERRLYQSASILSLSQKTFGSEVQPNKFSLSVTKGGITYNISDDGFGNLYDTNIGKDNFPNEDYRVFYLSPVKGFKRADLTIDYETGNEYVNVPFPNGYSDTVYDDSYFLNPVKFNKVNFVINNNSNSHNIRSAASDSYIKIPHRPQFNFENTEDFTINFYYDLNQVDHNNSTSSLDYFILTKEGTKTVPILPSEGTQYTSLSATGSAKLGTAPVGPQFPYRIYYKGNYPAANTASLFFEKSDGETTQFVSASFFLSGSTETQKFISCVNDDGNLTLHVYGNGNEVKESSTDQNSPTLSKTTSNKADITLYNKPNPNGSYSNFIGYEGGQISQLMIWNQALSTSEVINISKSIVGTPNVGNLFYDNGFAVLTHPKYMNLFDGASNVYVDYYNTHLITENEYQCTMTEDEFEFTTNISARKIPFSDNEDIANFATGSNFKPYITTVGLYDDNGNLLAVGKLGQPIKASSETDTTFVIRFDT